MDLLDVVAYGGILLFLCYGAFYIYKRARKEMKKLEEEK